MKVTARDVSHVADLASLELNDAERAAMVRDLNSILGYIDKLNEIDTANVEPMAHAGCDDATDPEKRSNRFPYGSREDGVEGLRKSLPQAAAMENAPDTDGTFFRVPKVIER